MAFSPNSYQQISLEDSTINLSKRSQKLLQKSWAHRFADIIFPAINEERFSVLYSDNPASRPNSPVNVLVGSFILKELFNLTDEELLESIYFDVRFQVALCTTSYREQPLSDRSFSRFRERLIKYEEDKGIDLLKEEMLALAEYFQKFLNINPNMKRMDSLMIASRSKRMTVLELLYISIVNMLKQLKNSDKESRIPKRMKHYLIEENYNEVIYRTNHDEVADKVQSCVKDIEYLLTHIPKECKEAEEYQILQRIYEERTMLGEDGKRIVNEKPSAKSLQNPSDPDATYRTKGGKGYQGYAGNIVETVDPEIGKSIITDFALEPNSHSDIAFCKEVIKNLEEKGSAEEILLVTDGAYGSAELQKEIQDSKVRLVTTNVNGRFVDEIFADFKMTDDGKSVISCPMGYVPEKSTYYKSNEMCHTYFKKEYCEKCPNADKCGVKPTKNYATVTVSEKKIMRAKHKRLLGTKEYKKLANIRNAVEGVMSVLRRRYRVDDIPVFGLVRSKLHFTCKIGAYNIKKVLAYTA